MKVTLEPIITYRASIDGQFVGEFRKDSEWHGLMSLKHVQSGEEIVATSPRASVFELFRSPEDSHEPLDVVMISPRLKPKPQEPPCSPAEPS